MSYFQLETHTHVYIEASTIDKSVPFIGLQCIWQDIYIQETQFYPSSVLFRNGLYGEKLKMKRTRLIGSHPVLVADNEARLLLVNL